MSGAVVLMVLGALLGCSVAASAQVSVEPASLPALLDRYRAQPEDWKLCHQIALAYTQAQQLDRAAEFYGKVTKLQPAFIPAAKNLATVLWFLDRKAESEAQFRALLRVIPQDQVPNLYVALAEHGRRQFAAAQRHFRQAGDLALRNPDVLPAVVESSLAMRDQSVVPAALKTVEEFDGQDPRLRLRLAIIFHQYGLAAATATVLEKVQQPDLDTHLLLAEAYDRQNLPERAYAAYRKAIEADPAQERPYLALANFASRHQNDRFALQVLDEGMRHHPESSLLPLHRGLVLALEGQQAEAERSFREAGQRTSSHVPLLALGVLQLESGRVEDAVRTFELAVRAAPEDHHALYFLALALTRTGGEGRLPQVLSLLGKARSIAPENAKVRTILGQTYVAMGRLAEGVSELRKGLAGDPNNQTALYQLSLAYRKQGKHAAAEQCLAKFRRLKAQNRENETELVQVLKIVR